VRDLATKKDFTVGQTVWHTASWGKPTGLVEGKVTKVGRLYVTIDDKFRFRLSDLLEDTDRGSRGKIYLDKKVYEDKVELNQNLSILRKSFSWDSEVTLEQTREILKILNKN
jgi:hypothetical protein